MTALLRPIVDWRDRQLALLARERRQCRSRVVVTITYGTGEVPFDG